MRKFLKKYDPSLHFVYTYLIAFILLGFTWFYQWILGLFMTVVLGVSLYYTIRQEQKESVEQEQYIMTLSHRVRKVGEEALLEMPVGIVLFSEDFEIEWTNNYLNQFADESTFVGEKLDIFSEALVTAIKENENNIRFYMKDRYFQVVIKKEERLFQKNNFHLAPEK